MSDGTEAIENARQAVRDRNFRALATSIDQISAEFRSMGQRLDKLERIVAQHSAVNQQAPAAIPRTVGPTG